MKDYQINGRERCYPDGREVQTTWKQSLSSIDPRKVGWKPCVNNVSQYPVFTNLPMYVGSALNRSGRAQKMHRRSPHLYVTPLGQTLYPTIRLAWGMLHSEPEIPWLKISRNWGGPAVRWTGQKNYSNIISALAADRKQWRRMIWGQAAADGWRPALVP